MKNQSPPVPGCSSLVDCLNTLDVALLEIAALADLLCTTLIAGQETPYRCKPTHPGIIAGVIERRTVEAQSHSAKMMELLPLPQIDSSRH